MTKRIGVLVIVLTLMMTMLIIPGSALASYTAYSCCSNGKPLNIRSGPGKDYTVIGTIAYGNPVEVIFDLGNGWSQIYWDNAYAFVMTSLITTQYPGKYNPGGTTPAPSPASTDTSLNAVFKKARFVTPYTVTLRGTRGSGSVNVRWAPSLESELIKVYAYGSQMTVICELGDWYQVVDPLTGVTGFVMRTFAFR